jgi:hypothetical protein
MPTSGCLIFTQSMPTSGCFSSMKSCVVQVSIFSVKPDFDWTINQELILAADSHTHLGIELNGKQSVFSRTTKAFRKGRNIYCAITSIKDDITSLFNLIKLYKYVVIPSVFNGCEVWNDLKSKESLHLNKCQQFDVKHTVKFSTLA